MSGWPLALAPGRHCVDGMSRSIGNKKFGYVISLQPIELNVGEECVQLIIDRVKASFIRREAPLPSTLALDP